MKTFSQYLYHTQKTYEFRIKVANVDVSEANLAAIKNALDAYGVESIGKPKRLPIQQHVDFPKMGPCECHVIDVSLNYPTTPELLTQIVSERALINKAQVCVKTKDQDEQANAAEEAGEHKGALLDKAELESNPDAQGVVGQARVGSLIKELEKLTRKTEFAATEKANTQSTNDLPQGTKSPVGSSQNKIPSPVKGK